MVGRLKFYDTNALLDGYEGLKNESCIYLSTITLKELENIKTSNRKDSDVKYKARKATRFLKENEDRYKCIITEQKHYDLLEELKLEVNNDNLIMATAYLLGKETGNKVTVITNDICFHNICKQVFKLKTEENKKVEDDYTGYLQVTMTDDEMAKFYEDKTNKFGLLTNQYLLIKNINGEVVDTYKYINDELVPINVDKYIFSTYLGDFRPKDIYQMLALESIQNNQLTLIKGKAGTGKSLIAMSTLLHQLEKEQIQKIVIFTNPLKVKGSQELGFYPGTRNEKLLSSMIGNFLISKLEDKLAVEMLINRGQLEILPMSDIRGFDTSGTKCGVYATEAQNTSISIMKLALQRIGDDCPTCIIDGDYNTQVDDVCFEGNNNGMKRISEVFRGQDFYGEVELKEIYRSKIAKIAELM